MLLSEILIAGNAGHSATDEVKNGHRVVKFSVAVGQKDNSTMWLNVTVFGSEGRNWLADDAARVKKGAHVLVKGRLEQRTYQGRDGQTKQSLEVVATQVGILTRPETTAKPAPDYPGHDATAAVEDPDSIPF